MKPNFVTFNFTNSSRSDMIDRIDHAITKLENESEEDDGKYFKAKAEYDVKGWFYRLTHFAPIRNNYMGFLSMINGSYISHLRRVKGALLLEPNELSLDIELANILKRYSD